MKNPQLTALSELGQSVWYDNLSRDVLNSGKLKQLIDAGVLGLTSNPTIFKKAIADSDNYDSAIKNLLSKNLDVDQLAEELMVEDVGQAADLLKEVYVKTQGIDGYASIEVSPELSDKTAETVEAGRRIWRKLNRPNIMIKVPATKEGIPAIKALVEEGINVNVTLIFSTLVYEDVIEAYISALEARLAKGLPISNISSVASFFVSRVDASAEKEFDKLLVDGKVCETKKELIVAKVGIANSKAAYKLYEDSFKSERFTLLANAGARVQRPLWASTGTKNPKFSKVLYVEELAGKDTVNTMPPDTLEALMQAATIEPRLHRGLDEAQSLITEVKAMGIDLPSLLVQLQHAGVKSFADSYAELIAALKEKCKKMA